MHGLEGRVSNPPASHHKGLHPRKLCVSVTLWCVVLSQKKCELMNWKSGMTISMRIKMMIVISSAVARE